MGFWFKRGLRFECTRCGRCCGGAPGEVRVSEGELSALARRFAVTMTQFKAMFTNTLRDGTVILRERRNYDCIFYDGRKGCLVYEDRPRQCRTWPFWRANLASSESWRDTGNLCPGIGRGRVHSDSEIQAMINNDGTSGQTSRGGTPQPL